MRMTGRRASSNVDDRRGMSGGKKAGLGLAGIVVVVVIALFTGQDPTAMLSQMGAAETQQTEGRTEFTEEEQQLATFSKQVLAGTEDVWTAEFKKMGKTYRAPKMVLFTSSVQTGCGGATSAVGPFYCSADEALYIDLSFFMEMKSKLGADGDFAYAYVIAHEVGHHVQHLLGTLDEAHSQMRSMSQKESNRISVRIELQADFYAGVWAYHDNKMFNSIEDGDIQEAIHCAEVIGDDYLQKKAQGYDVPESFTHGRSAQREKWLRKGLTTGDISQGNTFALSDAEL